MLGGWRRPLTARCLLSVNGRTDIRAQYLPLDATVFSVEAARDWGQLGIHELYNLLKVVFSTTQICLPDRRLALPSSAPSHLSEHGRPNKLAPHPAVVKNYSSCRPGTVSESLKPVRGTNRLIPAARLQVATQTRRTPSSYPAAMRSLSSVVRPACFVRNALTPFVVWGSHI